MGFSLPQLNSCCCGCTLRTGTLIILWLYLVGSILYLGSPYITPAQTSNSTVPAGTTTTPSPVSKYTEVKPLDIFTTICTLINIVVSGVGLYGVYKEIHLYLTPFLAWEAFFTIYQIIRTLIASFTFDVILSELIGFLLAFYLWLVVFSHYRVLKGSARPIQA